MELADIMAELGYTQEWLDAGIVDEEIVRQQYHDYINCVDPIHGSPEDYRWRAWLKWLESRESITDQEFDAVLKIHDEDRVNWAISLLESEALTDGQLDRMVLHPIFQQAIVQKIYARHIFYPKLSQEGLSDAVFELVRRSDDKFVQGAVLTRDDLQTEHVRWLSQHGVTRSIRNQCEQMLNSRRFRDSR